jgi:hypothetical protein
MDASIARLVRMMLRGIRTDAVIDVISAAEYFEDALMDNLALEFKHLDGAGYVYDDTEIVMHVEFTADGVTFGEHHEHPDTLKVIQCALHTLTHFEQMLLMSDDEDSTSEVDDWV